MKQFLLPLHTPSSIICQRPSLPSSPPLILSQRRQLNRSQNSSCASELQLQTHIAPLYPINTRPRSQQLLRPTITPRNVSWKRSAAEGELLKSSPGLHGSHTNELMLQIADACEIGTRTGICSRLDWIRTRGSPASRRIRLGRGYMTEKCRRKKEEEVPPTSLSSHLISTPRTVLER